jgi:hypothetical protein
MITNKYTAKRILFCMVMIFCLSVTGCGKENKTEDKAVGSCTLLVECSNVLNNMDQLDKSVKDYIPKDGIIMEKKEVKFYEDDNVYDVLKRELKKEGTLMEASFTGSSAYIEGISNLYEFSCGELSGWMYCVNGEYPNVGCSEYQIKNGDEIEWHYTCDLGEDLKN